MHIVEIELDMLEHSLKCSVMHHCETEHVYSPQEIQTDFY